MTIEQQRQEAQDETTSPERLRKLAISQDSFIRKYVAENPNTPTETLLNLSNEFPQQVLNNPVIPLLLIENPLLLTCQIRFDFEQIIHATNLLFKSLGWTKEDGQKYILQTYGKASRLLLSDEELLDFMRRLQNIKDSQSSLQS